MGKLIDKITKLLTEEDYIAELENDNNHLYADVIRLSRQHCELADANTKLVKILSDVMSDNEEYKSLENVLSELEKISNVYSVIAEQFEDIVHNNSFVDSNK